MLPCLYSKDFIHSFNHMEVSISAYTFPELVFSWAQFLFPYKQKALLIPE